MCTQFCGSIIQLRLGFHFLSRPTHYRIAVRKRRMVKLIIHRTHVNLSVLVFNRDPSICSSYIYVCIQQPTYMDVSRHTMLSCDVTQFVREKLLLKELLTWFTLFPNHRGVFVLYFYFRIGN